MKFFLATSLPTLALISSLGWSTPKHYLNISLSDGKRCFTTNGIPDHPIETFPNRGNSNAIQEQRVNVCIPLKPVKGDMPVPIKGTMGIAANGVQFRPNTSVYCNPKAKQGHSRTGDKNWSLDIFGAPGKLGLDFNNGHVGRGSLYHYHGIAKHLLSVSGGSLVGYAGDGFEVHYLPTGKQTGWALKRGERPAGGPAGAYNGLFNENYEYVGGENRLDHCNGGELKDSYAYFITDQYPFLPRCLYGNNSRDFNRSRHH